MQELMRLNGRILSLSVPTIAMINGHAYAGGLIFSFSHDFRVMRNDFGHLCLNEIELGINPPPGMISVVSGKTGNTKEYKDLLLTAKRFSSQEAFKLGWIDHIYEPQQFIEQTINLAQNLLKFNYNKENYKNLKVEMNKQSINCCFNKGLAVDVVAEAKIPSFAKL